MNQFTYLVTVGFFSWCFSPLLQTLKKPLAPCSLTAPAPWSRWLPVAPPHPHPISPKAAHPLALPPINDAHFSTRQKLTNYLLPNLDRSAIRMFYKFHQWNTVKCHYNACHYNANASLTRSILGSQTAPTSWHALMTVSELLSTWAKGVKSSRPDRPQRQWHPFVSIQME